MKNGKYLMSVAPPGYTGLKYRGRYAYDHHIVWWTTNKKTVPSGYVIHHKNGNKHDNRIENLELLKMDIHSQHHGGLSKNTRFAICPSCKNEFQQKKRPVQKFCSRQCIGFFNYPRVAQAVRAADC